MYTYIYIYLYHATENTANQNGGKPLYIRQYSAQPASPSIIAIQLYHTQPMKIEKWQQAAGAFMPFKRITKENGSIYNSTRERVDSRN